jgi:ABC-type Fe3+/spermidine/putrescine transport system ATPase subunit
MPNRLELEGVEKAFVGIRAVGGLSFAQDGAVVGLCGPNGSGKTTVFNCITGLYRPLMRAAFCFSDATSPVPTPYRIAHLGIGRTFQLVRIFPEMRALENLVVVARTRNGHDLLGARRPLARSPSCLAAEALLDLFDAGLERGDVALQLDEIALQDLAPPALVGKGGFYPAQGLRDRLILLLQALESAVDLVEVAEHLLPKLGDLSGELSVQCLEPAVDLGEPASQEVDELLILG